MAEKRKRVEEGKADDPSLKRSTGGIIVFARVDPACAASSDVAEGLTPVEVRTDAVVDDIISELNRIGAVWGKVEVEFQQKRLRSSDVLADVGMCPQSTLRVLPSPFRFRR
eukprot:Hpha_TRINITY_DN27513_c0_g1::TRINITY_DN27513_c0_g1_i1::g.86233::m.86233